MRLVSAIALGVSSGVVLGFGSGAYAYSSGAATCSYPNAGWTQMGGGQPGSGGFVLTVLDDMGPATHYIPGTQYTVIISNSVGYAGFLLQCVRGIPGFPGEDGVGTFSWTDDNLYQHGPCTQAPSSVTQRTDRAQARLAVDTFTWTAPDPGRGSVTFHLVGVVSQFAWYGFDQMITETLIEGPKTAVTSTTWAAIRSMYRPKHSQ